MGLLSPARAPSSAQGCLGDVIEPYTRHIGKEGMPGWLYQSLATGNRSETEWEVFLTHGARFSFLKGLGFNTPPPQKKVHRGIPLAEASARIQLAILTSVFIGHTLSSWEAGTSLPFYR